MNRQLSYLARVRAILSLAALTLGLWLVGPLANVQAADGGPDKAKIEADEKTIRETAEEFAKAFNKGDA